MKQIKLYLGCTLLVLSMLVPLLGFWVAQLALPVAVKAVVIGALTVGGPEVLAVLAVALLGKEAFHFLTGKVVGLLGKLRPTGSVGQARYKIGLVLFFASFLPAWILSYAPTIVSADVRILVCICSDVCFVVSLFVLGGDFWDKLTALFLYDAKVELPKGNE